MKKRKLDGAYYWGLLVNDKKFSDSDSGHTNPIGNLLKKLKDKSRQDTDKFFASVREIDGLYAADCMFCGKNFKQKKRAIVSIRRTCSEHCRKEHKRRQQKRTPTLDK